MKYLVIDSGGTFIKYALMNEQADIMEKDKVATPDYKTHTLEDYLDVLYSIYKRYDGQVAGIAMSTPGILDSETGVCYTGGTLAYISGQNMVEHIEARCRVPVTIENDGKLYKGNHFSAGEFSYVAVKEEHLDQLDGYWGFANGISALAEYVSKETGILRESLDGLRIFELADKGDERVLKAMDSYTKRLAVQIYNLQVLFDVERICIGGGISKQPLLLQFIKKNVEEFCERHPFRKFSPYIPTPIVTSCRFFNDSNLIGALYHYLNRKGEL